MAVSVKIKNLAPGAYFNAGPVEVVVLEHFTDCLLYTSVKTAGLDVKKFYLVSTDGEVATADFAIDLIWNLAEVLSLIHIYTAQ